MTTGSLGQGLSVANGMAIASKIDKINNRVYCLLGDGELEEGQIWEACMTASKYKLDNLCAIVDCNNLQLTGDTESVKGLDSIKGKGVSFMENNVSWHGKAPSEEEYKNAIDEINKN